MRGSRGSEDCWLQQDEHAEPSEGPNFLRVRRTRLVRRGINNYVRIRLRGVRWRFHRQRARRKPHSSSPKIGGGSETSTYHPTRFRYDPPRSSLAETLPRLSLEVPDFELWMKELWDDFLIEPTPYLVASAITYLSFILLLTQYYTAIWQISCFFLQFVPWDDEFGL